MFDFRIVSDENHREQIMMDILSAFLNGIEIDEINTEAELMAAIEWEAFDFTKKNKERIDNEEENPLITDYIKRYGLSTEDVEPVTDSVTKD